jgi:ribosomal protein S18 acetylase RimI-like enzyme
MSNAILYRKCMSASDFDEAKILFTEYVDSLQIDLSFQEFEKELQIIDHQYGEPEGALLLAFTDSMVVACVGVRKLTNDTAELKRMYVRPAFRRQNIGVALLKMSIDVATELGYQKMRLDSLRSMHQAISLYRRFGFYEIPAYRFNPLEGAIYMEKQLVL